mgnify:FL=1
MFIHLGEDVVIHSDEVIAILDWRIIEKSEIMAAFIDRYKEDGKVIDIGKKFTKSIVITTETVYVSPLSSLTLKRRANVVADLEQIEE